MRFFDLVSRAMLGIAVSIMLPRALLAEEGSWSGTTAVTMLSDYVWRGYNLYDGFSIQPELSGTYSKSTEIGDHSLTAGTWMHFSAEGNQPPGPFNELDLYLSYALTTGPITFSTGVYWYRYPRPSVVFGPSSEVQAGIAVAAPLNPSIDVYHDYKRYDGTTIDVNFSHEIPLSFLGEIGDGITLTPGVNPIFGVNAPKLFYNDGLEAITYKLTLSIPIGNANLSPVIAYTKGYDDWTDNEWWNGMTLAVQF